MTAITVEICGVPDTPNYPYRIMPTYNGMRAGSGEMPISAVAATLLVCQCISWGGSVSGIVGSGAAADLIWQEYFSASNGGVTVSIWTAQVVGAPWGTASSPGGISFTGSFPDSAEAMCFGLIGASGGFDPGAGLPGATSSASLTYSLSYSNSALVAFQAQQNYSPGFGNPYPQSFSNIITQGGFQGSQEVILGSWFYAPGTVLTNVTTDSSIGGPYPLFMMVGFAGFAVVPNVIGDSLSAAEAAIAAAPLSVGTIRYVTDPSPPGTVLAQAPVGGASVQPESPVNLIVSGVSTLSAYGKFAQATAYPPNLLVNAAGIEPQIYIPRENRTVQA